MYFQEPASGVSVQETVAEMTEHEPLIDPAGALVYASYRVTEYEVISVPELVLLAGKVMSTVRFFEGVTVALGVAPWGRVPATATGKLLLVEKAMYAERGTHRK